MEFCSSLYEPKLFKMKEISFKLFLLLLLQVSVVNTLERDSDYMEGHAHITQKTVESWAKQITEQLEAWESKLIDSERLKKSLHVPPFLRDGAALVDEISRRIEAVTVTRAAAAERIARHVEKMAAANIDTPKIPKPGTTFRPSVELDKYKSWKEADKDNDQYMFDHSCRGYRPIYLDPSSQFAANVTREFSSAHVPVETFDCSDAVLWELNKTESLDVEFRKNYAKDATFSWQYFCSAKGFLRHYPAASWESMAGAAQGDEDEPDVYDCRLRAWYIEATGAPRDILVLFDSTGSMSNISQPGYELTRELFTALTDDDHVNVYRFNRELFSTVPCFNGTLVPANHINVAALLAHQSEFVPRNYTDLPQILRSAVEILNKSRERTETPPACQQAIVLITDCVPENYTAMYRKFDPEGRIRVFAFVIGQGDIQLAHARHLVCENDGYWDQLETSNDASEQARQILKVLERPAVLYHQKHLNKRRDPVWGDLYAHVQDTRYAVNRWKIKEKAEQKSRYMRLRWNKKKFLSSDQLIADSQKNEHRSTLGHYSEEEDRDTQYQLMISVSVPAYDPVEKENVTYVIMEELQRNSTREERVARLLGVAGVDLPLDDLRLRLPYHKLGPGGSLSLIDHRGNVILHDHLRPVVAGDILKNGYRTVDILDVELPDDDLPPRTYSPVVAQLRDLIMRTEKGQKVMDMWVPYDGQRRALAESRHYYWQNVNDTGFTAVVSLPDLSGNVRTSGLYASSQEPGPDRELTRMQAQEALRALNETDFAIHPDWLYCRYIEKQLETREQELEHFLLRMSEEQDFQFQQLQYSVRHLKPGRLESPYLCDKELMSRLVWEARMTAWFSTDDGKQETASEGTLGSSTAFVATVGGLTRWRHHLAEGDGPDSVMADIVKVAARGPNEPWYRRAVAAGEKTLTVHTAVATNAPAGWLTAVRPLRHLGVTGLHFRMSHLTGLLSAVTGPLCESGDCPVACGTDNWNCVLIDDAGWVLAGSALHYSGQASHLATADPRAMRQLLEAKVFQKKWLHDYQGICFAPQDYGLEGSAAVILPTKIWHWVAETIRCLVVHAHSMMQYLMLFSLMGPNVAARKSNKAKLEEEKRKIYDPRVLINKTLPTTCDRRRAIYTLSPNAPLYLAHQSGVDCANWSMVAAVVPRTNMLLLALYRLCPDEAQAEKMDDPRDNLELEPPMVEGSEAMEIRLACWRHFRSTKLLARGPEAVCRAHSRPDEQEFRLCGDLVPDKPKSEASSLSAEYFARLLLYLLLLCSVTDILF